MNKKADGLTLRADAWIRMYIRLVCVLTRVRLRACACSVAFALMWFVDRKSEMLL